MVGRLEMSCVQAMMSSERRRQARAFRAETERLCRDVRCVVRGGGGVQWCVHL